MNGNCSQISYKVGIKEIAEYILALTLILIPIALHLVTALMGDALSQQGVLLLTLSAIPLMPVHELFHVVTAKIAGFRKVHVFFYAEKRLLAVGLGFRSPEPIPLGKWRLIALAPLAFLTPLLTILSLLSGNSSRLLVAGMFFWNILGSVGDLILVAVTIGAPKTALIVDMGTGFSLNSKPSLMGWLIAESFLALLLAVTATFLTVLLPFYLASSSKGITGFGYIYAVIAASLVFTSYMLTLGRRRAKEKLREAFKLP